MKDGFWYRLSLKGVSGLFFCLSVLLFSSCRIKIHGQNYWGQIEASKRPAIATFWHYSIFFILYFMRKKKGVAMVSASRDGEYVNRIVRDLGYETVRGSRSRGGVQALKGMIRHIRQGRNAAIVADGSQGPARVVQAGSIVLASKTGAPILPMLWSCSRHLRFGSWDGTAIPLPFTRIDFFYGRPLEVPEKIKSPEVERYRLLLEERLNVLYVKAWGLQGRQGH